MILSTTPQIEGRPIREYKGVVTGETIIGANVFRDCCCLSQVFHQKRVDQLGRNQEERVGLVAFLSL